MNDRRSVTQLGHPEYSSNQTSVLTNIIFDSVINRKSKSKRVHIYLTGL